MSIVHRSSAACLAALLWCSAPCVAQEKEADVQKAKETLLEHLAKEGVKVDLEAKTVSVPAVMNEPQDPLEYLLIHRRGKAHEAVFVTEAKPSLINSAFLLLGLEPGKNASYKPIEPPPTEEEVAAGADWVKVFPPEGTRLWISAKWKAQGETPANEVVVEDLIVDLTSRELLDDTEWIFLGGRMAPLYKNEPPVFVADFEGNLVSICYLSPANHLATMKHERARDDQNWWMSKICPPPGTEVHVVFHLTKPKIMTKREKRLEQERAKKRDEKAGSKSGADKKDPEAVK